MSDSVPSVLETGSGKEPIGRDETTALFAALSSFKRLAVAVSGGADSVALLCLLVEWKEAVGWPGDFRALTVDHGLRLESRAEAAFVGDVCHRLGVAHQTLLWEGEKPVANVQAEARNARYRLFAAAMDQHDLEAVLLAHHQGDQVETFLDRLTRGSGVYGLAAMKLDDPHGPSGLRVLRPLLQTPKSRLTATLRAHGQSWCEDPSNENESFKRVRLRRLAEALAAEGLDTARLAETARRMGRAADALDQWVGELFLTRVQEHPAGPARMAREDYLCVPEEVRLRLLTRLLQKVGRHTGPQGVPLRLSKLEGLDQAIRGLSRTGDGLRQTLNGCSIHIDQQWLVIGAEMGRVPAETVCLDDVEHVVWDNRYIWTRGGARMDFLSDVADRAGDIGSGLKLGPLGEAPGRVSAKDADWAIHGAFDRSPAIWLGDRLLLVPGLSVEGLSVEEAEAETVLRAGYLSAI
ncbi:tRNA lysidine(34) synthetase TilS [Roseibium sp.]|uniref:tRNA lysidine(34) synthetase TilS n=1 Tax=Roseibium sp. TaxID=1936156 RepID=UPI003A976CC0